MKARKQPAGAAASSSSSSQKQQPSSSSSQPGAGGDVALGARPVVDDAEDINSGFGDWLRSADGVAYMRLFVVANSLVMFMTLSWPQITMVLEMIGEYFAEWK